MNSTTHQQTDASAIAHPLVRVRRINPSAALPEYKTSHAAGMDLAACLPDGAVTIPPGDIRMIPCGFAMALPDGYEAQVRPRSGLASRHAITLPNAPGTIDADYRGEVMVPLINHGREAFTVAHHDRVAQMIIAPVARAELTLVDDLGDTERGAGGFGSTGV
jgi:dUTP pyrophosphatase